MSVRVMTDVWGQSRHKGSALLLLLAIADHTNDEDRASWAGIKSLAQKTRLSERAVRYLIADLVASGELAVVPESGPVLKATRGRSERRADLLVVVLGSSENFSLPRAELAQTVQRTRANGAAKSCKPCSVHNICIEPSVEPSVEPSEAPSPSFSDFWSVWPHEHRVGRKQAEEVWKKLNAEDRVRAYSELQWRVAHDARYQRPSMDGKWSIPHPFRWLRDRRFEDARPKILVTKQSMRAENVDRLAREDFYIV